MAFSTLFLIVSLSALLALAVDGQLSDDKFYKPSCPNLHGIVRSTMAQALAKERRLGASVLRLFFHDCFVNGCDGSVLLDDTPTFTGEKNAFPNRNSARGFEVIDTIKSKVEAKCGNTVSCADILALASRDGVFLLGGPHWEVRLGRRDARTASQADANVNLPPPFASLQNIIDLFAAKGFNAREMTALSGGHSIGLAQCRAYRNHIYNETNIDPKFAALRQQTCPFSGGDSNLGPFDTQPNKFGNEYYKNLVARRGLLHSDQELYNGGSQDSLVELYSKKPKAFRDDFSAAMVKMGNLSPLTGVDGEIRLNCRVVN